MQNFPLTNISRIQQYTVRERQQREHCVMSCQAQNHIYSILIDYLSRREMKITLNIRVFIPSTFVVIEPTTFFF